MCPDCLSLYVLDKVYLTPFSILECFLSSRWILTNIFWKLFSNIKKGIKYTLSYVFSLDGSDICRTICGFTLLFLFVYLKTYYSSALSNYFCNHIFIVHICTLYLRVFSVGLLCWSSSMLMSWLYTWYYIYLTFKPFLYIWIIWMHICIYLLMKIRPMPIFWVNKHFLIHCTLRQSRVVSVDKELINLVIESTWRDNCLWSSVI